MPLTALTTEGWLALTDPADKIAFLRAPLSARKVRLFGCHCCRRFWDALPPEGRDALTVAERFADELATEVERQEALQRFVESRGGHIRHYIYSRPRYTVALPNDPITDAL